MNCDFCKGWVFLFFIIFNMVIKLFLGYFFIYIMLFVFFNVIVICNSVLLLFLDVIILLKLKELFKDDSDVLSSWLFFIVFCFGNKNNWEGVICLRGGNIWGLRFENMGFLGSIDVNFFIRLYRLRSVSFMNNSFGGLMFDFRKLKVLKSIFIFFNNFEGFIDFNVFEGMKCLRKVYLVYNKFSGEFLNLLIIM